MCVGCDISWPFLVGFVVGSRCPETVKRKHSKWRKSASSITHDDKQNVYASVW